MSRFYLCLSLLVFVCSGCRTDQTQLSKGATTAELRAIKGNLQIRSGGESRGAYRRDRLGVGDTVQIPEGALGWMRRDGGATWLVSGPSTLRLDEKKTELRGGRAFVDTEEGQPTVVVTPSGEVELSGARASIEVLKERATVYLLRGSARGATGSRAEAGEMLTLSEKEVKKTSVVSFQDWTGGLATADPSAAPAPFGIGTVGARKPGEKGKPRASLVIERLDVNVTIDHDLAFTEVDQTFVNPSSETVEGVFRFRTPLDATLSQFGVDREGRLVWGRVKESRSAQQVYESHVYEGSTEDPALLAWESPGVYSARLYPIFKGAQRRVVTRYAQWLDRQGERGERRLYVYPMAAEGAKNSLPRIEEMTVKIDVSRAGARTIRTGMGGVRRGDEIIVQAFDFVPRADLAVELFDEGGTELAGFRAPHALPDAEIPEGRDQEFAREVEKAESDYVAIPLRVPESKQEKDGIDLAIVIDTSAATEPSALSIGRSLVEALLSHLGPKDRAVLFAGDSALRPVAEGSSKYVEVTGDVRKRWLAGLSSIERGGATDLGALMTEAATSLDPTRASAVVYVGDGTPSVGEIAPADLRKRLARLPAHTRILPIAVGSQPNVPLLSTVARGGSVQVVEDAYGAARSALDILELVSRPTWIGARVDLGPGVDRVLPEVLPPLAPGETVMVVGRRIGKLPSEVVLEGSRGKARYPVHFDRIEDRGDLRRRWGTIRLGGLIEEGAGRATLVDLSERYGLISPFTSLYVPTKAEEEVEDYEDEASFYEKREAQRLRWKPWARDADFVMAASQQERAPMEAAYVEEPADNKEGGTGTRAKGEEGSMGKETNKRYAVKGPSDSPDPHLARQQALREAKDFGMIGMLNQAPEEEAAEEVSASVQLEQLEEARAAPSSARADASRGRRPSSAPKRRAPGSPCSPGDPMCGDFGAVAPPPPPEDDERSAKGNMWGDEVGDGKASGGLGLSGVGDAGGGEGDGIGLGSIGTLGKGAGQGLGAGSGRLGGSHSGPAPRMRGGTPVVNGRLPSEVVRRIVRQNFGRFRLCYEQGLGRNPNLQGRVLLRFVIGTGGNVVSANHGGDFPDPGVPACMTSALSGLSFPKPESGVVQVQYPILLSPSSSPDAPTVELASDDEGSQSSHSIARVGHRPIPCGAGADLPLSERRTLWRERLAGASVDRAVSVYSSALRDCEAANWRERALLLVLMVDSLPDVMNRVQLWRTLLRVSPGAADAVYRFLALRVRTAEQLRELHQALGFQQVEPEILEALLKRGRTPQEKLTLLRGTAEKYPDDSELALRVLDAYEDARDEAGGRAWARKLRARFDATSHLRTSVGEYYLRLAKKGGEVGKRDETEGLRTFGEIVEFAPEDPLARRHLGDLLSAHGWHDQALRHYQTLERLTPDDPTVKLLLARAAHGTGKTERAVRLAEQAAGGSAPDSRQPAMIASRALSSAFLADARIASQKGKKKDELARLRGRAARLRAKQAGAGRRVILVWSHPELRPTLWTNALGAMMPAADNLPLLRVAETHVPSEVSPTVEIRLDEQDALVAARLGLSAVLFILEDEGEDNEAIHRLNIDFSSEKRKRSDVVTLTFDSGKWKEVTL